MSSSVAGVKAQFVTVPTPFIAVAAIAPPFRVAIAPDPALVGLVGAAPVPGMTISPFAAPHVSFVVVSPVRATIEQE